ncbi:hypothetical protein, partial [Falsiroseomonas oryzae]|uniref:hypothetical protein n=1 Tax=Falsiroseomonas oryzae TaxID=2766473 RepID=UPI0022EB696B
GPRRAEAPAPTRLAGGTAPSGRFSAIDPLSDAGLADVCAAHAFCIHAGPAAALGCGCGGDVFAALVARGLERNG